MRLVDELRAEHPVIERVLGSLRTYAGRRARGEAPASDAAGFLSFFRDFAGRFHHEREEDTLFRALVDQAELGRGSGPVRSLFLQHLSMARTLDGFAPLLGKEVLTPDEAAALTDGVKAYSHALLAHIDAEESVLFPEGETRLKRAGVAELPCREPSPEERRAREEGGRLAALYPPSEDREAIRGEGCVICPSLGVTCGGLEQEWWTDAEWESFEERQG